MSRSRGTHHRFFSGGEEKGLEGGGNSTGEDQILFKNVVMEDLIGRGTFTLLHRAHEGYRQFAIKTLKGVLVTGMYRVTYTMITCL